MSFYEDKILPHMIDLACGTRQVRKQRDKIVPRAAGDVLEIGFGSGRNLPHYDAAKVRRLWALEPSAGMRRLAADPIAASPLDVELIDLDEDTIPLDDNRADSVVITYTLCTIPDAVAALREVRRVLRPDGTLFFCEHGRAPDPGVHRWQRRLNGPWSRLAGGCNMDRDIPALLRQAGFTIGDDNRMYIPGIRMLSYNFWGAAQ